MEIFIDVLKDVMIDGLKVLPFLFITYLVMELIEHKTGNKAKKIIKKSGRFGPLLGGLLGVVPQCGFSAASAALYSARILSLGTLIAVFLSTSDEMLPIMISEAVEPALIFKILGIKLVLGIIYGFIIDLVIFLFNRNKAKKEEEESEEIAHMCEHDHCHCEKGIFRSTFKHTFSTWLFILLVTLIVGLIIGYIGEDNVKEFIAHIPVVGLLVSGLFGLLPNCAGSVIITELYLEQMISFGSMMAGLLIASGVGILVLFRTNKHLKQNLAIVSVLYVLGIISGLILDLIF